MLSIFEMYTTFMPFPFLLLVYLYFETVKQCKSLQSVLGPSGLQTRALMCILNHP